MPDYAEMLAAWNNTARLWDVSRTEALARDRAVILTAALARGIGWRSASEQADILMQDAPDDLYEAARARLLDPRTYPAEEIARRERLLGQTIADLNAPLHPNCYPAPRSSLRSSGERRQGCALPRPTAIAGSGKTPQHHSREGANPFIKLEQALTWVSAFAETTLRRNCPPRRIGWRRQRYAQLRRFLKKPFVSRRHPSW